MAQHGGTGCGDVYRLLTAYGGVRDLLVMAHAPAPGNVSSWHNGLIYEIYVIAGNDSYRGLNITD